MLQHLYISMYNLFIFVYMYNLVRMHTQKCTCVHCKNQVLKYDLINLYIGLLYTERKDA